MRPLLGAVCTVAALVVAGCSHAGAQLTQRQPIIDMHRHTPWPGDSDAEGLPQIRNALRAHNVVASALFITGREDLEHYRSDDRSRFLLSPMFPCPALTLARKWCFTESDTVFPDPAWIDRQLSTGAIAGIGELVFSYAGIPPDDPTMDRFWALAAKHDVPAFVHTGRGPDAGQGPRRHAGCCPAYSPDYGNPAHLRAVLTAYPDLRLVLQHVGIEYLDETLALMRDFPGVYADMSVLNSVGPSEVHDASLRRLVDAGFAARIVLGSDDQEYDLIIERIEGASFLTSSQRQAIYYDNAARFLRLDQATIDADYAR